MDHFCRQQHYLDEATTAAGQLRGSPYRMGEPSNVSQLRERRFFFFFFVQRLSPEAVELLLAINCCQSSLCRAIWRPRALHGIFPSAVNGEKSPGKNRPPVSEVLKTLNAGPPNDAWRVEMPLVEGRMGASVCGPASIISPLSLKKPPCARWTDSRVSRPPVLQEPQSNRRPSSSH